MTYIIFFDIDNTLLEGGKSKVSANTKQMLEHLSKRNDVILGIATGRGPSRLDEVKDILKYFDALVLGNGCYVKLFGQVIYTNFFSKKELKKIKEIVGNIEGIFIGGSTINHPFILDKEAKELNRQEEVYLIDDIGDETCHLWINGFDFESLKPIQEKLNPYFDTYIQEKPGLDIVHKGDGKFKGIEIVIKKLNLKTTLICCGDGQNDYEMIKNADIGICMANTNFPKLKSVAKYIAPSVMEDKWFEFFKEINIL
ncbi:MAG: HAD family hydrolase [Acholeplasmataceae bacterium]|jgi:peptidyl-prolyl cis-trans isomerase B (cyclophilin B)